MVFVFYYIHNYIRAISFLQQIYIMKHMPYNCLFITAEKKSIIYYNLDVHYSLYIFIRVSTIYNL